MAKKLVLLFVEGPIDQHVFNPIAEELSSSHLNIEVQPTDGDLFQLGSRRKILNAIAGITLNELDRRNLTVDDLQSVYYLIDVDGTYIPRSQFSINASLPHGEFNYEPIGQTVNVVTAKQKDGLINHWDDKTVHINSVLQAGHITVQKTTIPIKLFYNNLTLEHVLMDNPIRGAREKQRKSRQGNSFQIAINNQVEKNGSTYVTELENFFSKLQHGATIADSWNYVMHHPWERLSSVYLMLQMLKQE